nr:MAG TPA: hypothetical protein [Ackermannviridae sp.]
MCSCSLLIVIFHPLCICCLGFYYTKNKINVNI